MNKRPFHVVVHNGEHYIRNHTDGVLTGPFLADDVHRACNRWNDQCEANLNAIKHIPFKPATPSRHYFNVDEREQSERIDMFRQEI
jgi:hypothetical protein